MIQGKTKGIKSSEFWISIMGMVGGILCTLFAGNPWAEMAGAVLASVCGASYNSSRSTIKKALASAEAVKAVTEGKPSDSEEK